MTVENHHSAEEFAQLQETMRKQSEYNPAWHQDTPKLDQTLAEMLQTPHPRDLLIRGGTGTGKSWAASHTAELLRAAGHMVIQMRVVDDRPNQDLYIYDEIEKADPDGIPAEVDIKLPFRQSGLSGSWQHELAAAVDELIVRLPSYVPYSEKVMGSAPIVADFQVFAQELAQIMGQKPVSLILDGTYKLPGAVRLRINNALNENKQALRIKTRNLAPLSDADKNRSTVFNIHDETSWPENIAKEQLVKRGLIKDTDTENLERIWLMGHGNPRLLIACAAAKTPEQGIAYLRSEFMKRIPEDLRQHIDTLSILDAYFSPEDLAEFIATDNTTQIIKQLEQAGIITSAVDPRQNSFDPYRFDPAIARVFNTSLQKNDFSTWQELERIAGDMFENKHKNGYNLLPGYTYEQLAAHHKHIYTESFENKP